MVCFAIRDVKEMIGFRAYPISLTFPVRLVSKIMMQHV